MIQEAKLIRLGKYKGVRLPGPMVMRHGLVDEVFIEDLPNGILIYSKHTPKLSWEDTYKEMREERENWSDWHGFEDE